MKAVTWTQVAQYIVLIVAYLIPVIWMSAKKFGLPIFPSSLIWPGAPADRHARAGICPEGPRRRLRADNTAPFTRYSPANYFWLIFCLMVGTASLPHV